MADIELVIKIPEKTYKHILSMQFYIPGLRSGKSLLEEVLKAIRTGKQLPKGHGKLGDLDKVADKLETLRDGWNYYGNEYESGMYKGYDYSLDEIMDASTIIEADKAESEETDA